MKGQVIPRVTSAKAGTGLKNTTIGKNAVIIPISKNKVDTNMPYQNIMEPWDAVNS